MLGEEFKVRALHEGQRYGEDKMVFLRELAQNARDAGASRIDVITEHSGGEMVVYFKDDGAGMSLRHARKYLFTLYASSKEWESKSAGRFGVGFWSVLLFQPASVEIESKKNKRRGWRIAMEGDLSNTELKTCRLRSSGTGVAVRKAILDGGDYDRLKADIHSALARYCRFLRRNDKRATPLPVYFNGVLVSEPFKLDGPCWMTFNDGKVEGAVGLGSVPRVELYARGLPVWRGTVLEELKYSAAPVKDDRHPEGLAPVYLLCGNNLNVTLDRRAVVDDGALDAVRRKARRRMRELLWRYLDEVTPRDFLSRMSDRLEAFIEDMRLSNYLFAKVILLLAPLLAVVLGMVLYGAMGHGPKEAGESDSDVGVVSTVDTGLSVHVGSLKAVSDRAPLGNPEPFNGPSVSPVFSGEKLPLIYSPPADINFRLAAYENLHSGLGIVGSKPLMVAKSGNFVCKENCIDVEVEVGADSGSLLIPVPTGYEVEQRSVVFHGGVLEKLGVSSSQEPMAEIRGEDGGTLQYRVGPKVSILNTDHRARLLALPAHMNAPDELKRAVARASKDESVAQRVEALRKFVEGRVAYDDSPKAFRAYDAFLKRDPKAGWLEFVLTYGRGDCDIKNALLVVLLRHMGVPARLAIGVVGKGGGTLRGVHAWAEYYDKGWRAADATGTAGETAAPPAAGVHADVGATRTSSSPAEVVDQGVQFSIYDRIGPLLPAAGITVLVALAVVAFLIIVAARPNDLYAPGDEEEKREVAAEMLTNAMTHPEAWQKGGGIAARRLLPVIGRRRGMSLREALDRGLKRTLWYSSGQSELATRSARGAARVLDASDSIWGPLVRRLPGIIDLDEIAELMPMEPDQMTGELAGVGRLIARINALLEKAGFEEGTIVACGNMGEALARDVDLSSLLDGARYRWPARFVAVNPRAEEIEEEARLCGDNEALAVFNALDLLTQKSSLLGSAREHILKSAALAAIEEAR